MKTILVATNHLEGVGGTETFSYTLIEELVRRGYDVEYFCFKKGLYSDKIENELNVKFSSKENYDLILANHYTCVDAIFSKGFTIQTCHGIFPKLEQPAIKADAYVAISQEVQNHLAKKGYSSLIILNGINLNKFKNYNPVEKELKTVLSLCHSKEANDFISQICNANGIELIKAFKYENPIWNMEKIINKADLVIGLGRSAFEAMACGRPVVVFDKRRYFESYGDGYVRENLGLSLLNNCSGRYSKKTYDSASLQAEILKYNSNDSCFFRKFAENELDIKNAVDQYLGYFEDLLLNKSVLKKKQMHFFLINFFGKRGSVFIYKFRNLLKLKLNG